MSSIIFSIFVIGASVLFALNIRKIISNIKLGKSLDRSDQSAKRWKTMARVAMGQSKMTRKPVAGFFHILIYVAFVITQVELIEILVDGISGSHRFFQPYLGGLYT